MLACPGWILNDECYVDKKKPLWPDMPWIPT